MTESQDNVIDFRKFREKVQPGTQSRTYKAWLAKAPQSDTSFIAFHSSDGQINLVRKRLIQEYLFTSDQYLSVFCADCLITLQGRNLDLLFDLLQHEQIRSLHCFDPKIHEKPVGNEIVITRIECR